MLQGILLLLQNVDWSEPWIIGLLVFHSLSTGAVFLLYKTQAFNIQVALFGVLMVLACLTETVNEYGATHWKLFARHQYFDTNGFFITWMYAAPIVVNCLLIIISWLWTTVQLMIRLKKAQRRTTSKQQAQQVQQTTSSLIKKPKKEREHQD
ncbi:transmembrane protein 18-like isoform X1 [Corticium candelabrum]|uniref:transmembrane protein 18-like isoform X1 n=1 Tax=Corticium candelabrum TaxID=121492 RepID=UPI002E2756BD|nr:transmembrane protein 18-like isoform X1 [Corticium candelabrum]